MIKKISGIFLVLLLFCVTFCGCSGDDPKDTKAEVDGKQLSANEILEETRNDAMLFYNLYAEKKVEVTGTVEQIKEVYITLLSREVKVYEVVLKEGWLVQLIIKDHPEVVNIQEGDKVTILSRMSICDAVNEYIIMEDISISGTGSNSEYKDNSTIVKH